MKRKKSQAKYHFALLLLTKLIATVIIGSIGIGNLKRGRQRHNKIV
jgi:uncharacterized protein (UPF0333 family)